MRRLLLMSLACLAATTALGAQNWPAFRGANASGVAEGPAPTTWDAARGVNVAWKTPVPGLAVSSPVVWGNRVFVSTAVGGRPDLGIRTGLYGDVEPIDDRSPHSFRVLALDRTTGRVLWDREAKAGVPRSKRHPKSSRATPTPVTDGRRLIVSFGAEGLYAFDMDGRPLWQRDLGPLSAGWFYDPDYEWGVGSSPIVWRDLVIVQCDIQKNSFIAAFNAATGAPVWRTDRDEIPSWSTPTIFEHDGKTELVTQGTNFIRGYDPQTGRELWRLSGNSEITVPTPIVGPGLVIVTNGYQKVQPIFAIRPGASGDISLKGDDTTSPAIAWSTKRGGPYLPTPVLYRDLLYVCVNNGVVSAYDPRTGDRKYQARLGDGGSFTASPVAADGKVYFTSEDGDVYVVKAGPVYELLARNPVGESVLATPAISSGLLIVRGSKHVIAIGEQPAARPR